MKCDTCKGTVSLKGCGASGANADGPEEEDTGNMSCRKHRRKPRINRNQFYAFSCRKCVMGKLPFKSRRRV
jgi:hypothetical protein